MRIPFYKYQGTGNDFIIIDDRSLTFPMKDYDLVARLCHRRFGIGADGLMLLQNAEGYDFRMVYYNADGKEGSMCGNGGRCLVAFAHHQGVFQGKTRFIAVDGEHEAEVLPDGQVKLKMIDVDYLEVGPDYYFLNTGSPHYVRWVDNLGRYPVFEEGSKVRYNDRFGPRGGTNVNFIELDDKGVLHIRTYERGVEDETYSCGTGVVASAIAAFHQNPPEEIRVKAIGGDLRVSFGKYNPEFRDVYLTGPAVKVYEGETEI